MPYLLARRGLADFCSCRVSAGRKHALQLKAVGRADLTEQGSSGLAFAAAPCSWAVCREVVKAAMVKRLLEQGGCARNALGAMGQAVVQPNAHKKTQKSLFLTFICFLTSQLCIVAEEALGQTGEGQAGCAG